MFAFMLLLTMKMSDESFVKTDGRFSSGFVPLLI